MPIIAPICPYCGRKSKQVDSSIVYWGKSYGPVWVCGDYPTCDSYVGCHADGAPLGTLANKTLRKERNKAHAIFDPLWKMRKFKNRFKAYEWLAKEMGIKREACHIGMFNENQCKQAVNICKKYILANFTPSDRRKIFPDISFNGSEQLPLF